MQGYIRSLVEAGASHAHGAWIKGHQDPAEFAAVVSKEYERIISEWHVRRGYVRMAFGMILTTEVPGRGATPATWVEW